MKSSTLAWMALAALAPALASAQQPVLPQPAAIAATRAALVNGKPVPKSRVDAIVKQQVAQGAPDGEQLRKAVTDRLVGLELIAQEAEKKGLTKNAELRDQLEVTRQEVLLNAYMNDYFKSRPITDATMRAEYDKVKAQRAGKEFKVRHVLVENESEAKTIIGQMEKGAKLEEFAKMSKDQGSKEKGGDLGWASPTTYVKPFADALGKLDKGAYTHEPVQSQFGWHVIQVDDTRNATFPPYDQVKPQLQNMMQQQELQKVITDLRAKAKVE